MRTSRESQSYTVQGAKASLISDCDIDESNVMSNSNLISNKNQEDDLDDEYGPSMGWCAQWKSLSYNIKLILIYTLLWTSSISIWCRQVLSTYIYQVTGESTQTLGFIEGVQGGAYLISAIVAGILIDKSSSRIRILRFTGIIGLVIVVPVGCFTLLYVNTKYDDNADPHQMAKLLYKSIYYIWLFCYGICSSFAMTAINTVFADLIPKGRRDFIFSFRGFLRKLASTLGPIIIVIMFFCLGNHWKIYEMNIVLLSGIGLWIIPLLMLIFGFNVKELESTTHKNDLKEAENDTENSEQDNDKKEHKYKWIVPWVFSAHRLIFATGAGMTVKFFPIFFEQVIGLTPIALNSIWVATPLVTAICTILVERFAKFCDSRIIAMVVFNSFSIGCLIVMATITSKMTKYANWILVIAYILRCGSIRCPYPLEVSLMMDHVDKKNRGKWNALESINSTVWTLSAAMGGYLIGVLGYREIYLVTAGIYAFATATIVPLSFITK